MTDTEKAALCARIDELCAEVEALKRDEWSAGFNAGCEAVEAAYEDGKAHYEVENDKLRELVQGLWFAAQYLGMNPDGATGSGFARQMRELRLELG